MHDSKKKFGIIAKIFIPEYSSACSRKFPDNVRNRKKDSKKNNIQMFFANNKNFTGDRFL